MKIQLAIVSIFCSLLLLFAACSQSAKTDEKDRELIEKENELLKKENELLKKEQELSQKDVGENQQAQTEKTGKELRFLADLKGEYPHDVKLLENAVLQKRLKKMLGERYGFVKSIWEVETPIEIENGMMYTWAMQAHSGGDPGAVIMADLNKDVLYVGIRENGEGKLYSEDGSEAPQRLKDWAVE